MSVAKANLGADKALLRQQQLRVTQVAAEVRNSITALTAAKRAADAATTARELQGKLFAAAQESFSSGVYHQYLRDRAADLSGAGTDHRGSDQSGMAQGGGQLDRVLGQTLEKVGFD